MLLSQCVGNVSTLLTMDDFNFLHSRKGINNTSITMLITLTKLNKIKGGSVRFVAGGHQEAYVRHNVIKSVCTLVRWYGTMLLIKSDSSTDVSTESTCTKRKNAEGRS